MATAGRTPNPTALSPGTRDAQAPRCYQHAAFWSLSARSPSATAKWEDCAASKSRSRTEERSLQLSAIPFP
jgi:hypothetical protein